MNPLIAQIVGGVVGIIAGCVLVVGFHWIKQGRWPL